MDIPKELRYARTHEWVRLEGSSAPGGASPGGTAYVGISDYAQEALGDIVYVELPEPGREVGRGEEVATVESVKAASAIYAPLSGTLSGSNQALEQSPELLNRSPYEAHIYTLTVSDPAEMDDLMDADAYGRFLAEEQQKH